MVRSLASCAALCVLVAASLPLGGCIIGPCKDGQGNCVQLESTIEYAGEPSAQSVAYEAGQGVSIDSVLGDIDVVVGEGDEVRVTFSPFTRNTDDADGKAKATEDIEKRISLSVVEGDPVRVKVGRKDGASEFLGANIRVTLPAGFAGDFSATPGAGDLSADLREVEPTSTRVVSDLGDIELQGARGPLEITTANGDVDLSVVAWASSGEGKVVSGLGDVAISVPSSANGVLSLVGEDEIDVSGLPAEWESVENETGYTFTMGDGDGASVEVFTDSAFGVIRASAN